MIVSDDATVIARIAQQGGIIAYPTQAMFGLGCCANDITAINKLLTIKQRSADKGLILLASSLSQLDDYILPLTKNQQQKISQTTRATTWLVPAKPDVSPLLMGQYPTIAIRITQHPPTKTLCQLIDHPITSTSANLSGHPPATSAQEIINIFDNKINALLNSPTGNKQRPSTIIDLLNHHIIRH